jgi:hypothetical protein
MQICKRLFLCALFLSASSCALFAQAQPKSTRSANAWDTINNLLRVPEDGLTPAQRFKRGIHTPSIAVVTDSNTCSQVAAKRLFPRIYSKNQVVTIKNPNRVFSDPEKMSVSEVMDRANLELGLLMLHFFANNDSISKDRTICIGLAGLEKPNAISLEEGYIIADPRILFDVRRRTKFGDFSDRVIFLHEFAHQIQFWSADPFAADKTVRRTELTADCMSAAFLVLLWAKPGEDHGMTEQGLREVAASIGDFSAEEGHHGTPKERGAAATWGTNFILSRKKDLFMKISATEIRDACNDYVQSQPEDKLNHFD